MLTPTIDHSPLPGDEIQDIMADLNLSRSDIVETLGLGGAMTVWRWENEETMCEGAYALALRNLKPIREYFGITKSNQSQWSEPMAGAEVKDFRKAAHLYQNDLAKLLGLSRSSGNSTICRWETDATQCSGVYAFLIRVLDFLVKSDEVPKRSMSQQKAEIDDIIEALNTSGNLNEAAKQLDVSRRTLNRYLSKYSLDKTEFGIA